MRFQIPQALPWDVNVIKVNYRCLDAPRVHRDLDGYFAEPLVIRRVTVGAVDRPKGFDAVVQPRAAHIAMLPILNRSTLIFKDEDWLTPKHIFRFGVDNVRNARHVQT